MSVFASTPTGSPTPSVGLIIVHGIGGQKRDETADRLGNGVEQILRAAGVPSVTYQKSVDSQKEVSTLTLGNNVVKLYEVYWADLLKAEAVKGTFDVYDLYHTVLFPWLNRKYDPYRQEYSWCHVAGWLLLLVPAVIVFTLVKFILGLLTSGLRQEKQTRKVLWWNISVSERTDRTLVDDFLDEGLGDVFNYVHSSGRAEVKKKELRDVADHILRRFYSTLRQARDKDGCEQIQVVAHSLGSVIAYHGLTAYNLLPDETASAQPPFEPGITRVYTIGSPLEKIRFFWPKVISRDLMGAIRFAGDEARLAAKAETCSFRWDNFHDPFDFVSGRLKRFDHWLPVQNHRLFGLGGVLRSHSKYQSNAKFARILYEGLTGELPQYQPTFRQTAANYLRAALNVILSFGENVLALVAVVLLSLMGLAFILLFLAFFGFILTAMAGIVVFAVSLPLSYAGWMPIVDPRTWWSQLGAGVSFLVFWGVGISSAGLAMAATEPAKIWTAAKTEHELYWRV